MTDLKSPYGVIHFGGECKDNYANIRLYDQPPEGGSPVKLQSPALRAFKAAEVRYAKRSGWTAARIKKQGGRPIVLTGSWRACSLQYQLYRKDPSRYAHPNVGVHTRGLAIDVSTAQPNQAVIKACLRAEGWVQVRPDDEPWHHSFVVKA